MFDDVLNHFDHAHGGDRHRRQYTTDATSCSENETQNNTAFSSKADHPRSRDKDDGHTIRSAVAENPMLHANFTTLASIEPVSYTHLTLPTIYSV